MSIMSTSIRFNELLSGIVLVSLLAALAGAPGCTTPQDVKIEGKTPEQMGVIGAKIYQSPENADEILTNHQLTRSEFEQAVRKITAKSYLANRYRKAFEDELAKSEE